MKRAKNETQSKEPAQLRQGAALVREEEQRANLCIEHNRTPREYEPHENFIVGTQCRNLPDKVFLIAHFSAGMAWGGQIFISKAIEQPFPWGVG